MLQTFKNGQGSIILRIKLLDSSVTTGAGLTGLTSASSGLIISTIADVEATATAYTVAGSTIESITTLGTYAAPTATKVRFKEVDSTNHKGIYELHIADARFAVSNAKSLLVSIAGATNLVQADFVVQLTTDDPYVLKPTVTSILTTAVTEAYRSDGSAPTIAQALCEILAHLGEASISGTTKTIKKFDGTTSAATFTLDSGTTPTSITRAT